MRDKIAGYLLIFGIGLASFLIADTWHEANETNRIMRQILKSVEQSQ